MANDVEKRRRLGLFWALVFIVLIIAAVVPWLTPTGVYRTTILGIPQSVFVWLLLTVLFIAALFVFELTTWRKWRGEK
ncbi:MAG: hypothetical protein LUQ65_04635 [Candidatus Helarchaeota archaeon]|nr:hypothetical protein [Candidatus Helarchaeota archaeon]